MGMKEQLLRRKPIYPPAPHPGGLERGLGTFKLAMIGVGSTVGTGIFFVMHEAVPLAGPAVIVSFVIAGIAAGLSALCYAEMASTVPISGSSYSYAYATLGEIAAMGIAACLMLEYGVSTAAVASGWSGYLNLLLEDLFAWSIPDALSAAPAEGGIVNLPAIVLVWMCALLLISGTRESTLVNAIMVIIKLSVLVMFVFVAFTAFNADHFADFAPHGVAGITAAAGTIFFTFIGLDAVSTAGDEVRDPQRTLPRAIVIALVIVVSIYLAVAIAAVGAQPWEMFSDPSQQEAGLAVILQNIVNSDWPVTVFTAGAVISIFSVTLMTLFGQSRILFTIGRDGLIPKAFARVNPRTHTPEFAIVVVATAVSLLTGFVPLSSLWDLVSLGTLVAFVTVGIAVLVLRRTHPHLPQGFRVPGGPVIPILSIVSCLYLMVGLPPTTFLWFLLWLSIVLAFYLLWGRHRSTLGDPVAEALEEAGE